MKIKKLWPMPKRLGKYGQSLYRSVGRKLVQNRQLDAIDRDLFISLCQAWELSQKALDEIIADGISVDGGRKVLKKHPSFTIYKVSFDNYVKLCGHFGLSPLSRGEKFITTEKPTKKEKKVERFFKTVG